MKELGRGIINQTVILTESLKKLVMTQMRVDRVLEFQSDTGEFRREVYFLVQRRLIKIKPRQGQVAGLILPHPSHESRDGAWVLSLADDFHPLSSNQREIGPNTCATHGNVNCDG